jgi:hypothetical protein
MPAYYPGNIKNDFSSKVDFTDTVIASHINDLQSEVTAIETTVGTFPLTSSGWGTSGFDTTTTTWSTVKDRINNIEVGIANTRAQVAAITAETLAGTTLKSTITSSSLTSFGTAPVLNDPKVYISINAQTASYVPVLSDADKLVTMTVATANTFSIPTDASVAYPIGTKINVAQFGVGTTTISAVTPGTTTIVSAGATVAAPYTRVRYSAATCIKTGTDTWFVLGDIR